MDEARFHGLEAGVTGEALRFWEAPQPAVILGAFTRQERDVRADACRADGVPILRRFSGGGTVVVGPGCLNYSLLLSLEARPGLRRVEESYRAILGRIAAALALPGLAVAGLSDLAIGDLKVSGNAQRRGRRALLHHGTLLHAFDLASIERYLLPPARQPAYRARRPHAAFVTNLPIGPARMQTAIAAAWPLPPCA